MNITKEKTKVGTSVIDLRMVGRLLKDHLTKVKSVRVPTLAFSSVREYIDSYWGALWSGRTLPFRFKINGEVMKPTLWGRVSFATTFIIADSVYLLGRFGIWVMKKIPWKVSWLNLVLVAGCVIGFLGWGLPWFLDETGAMQQIEQSKTMQAIGEPVDMITVPEFKLPIMWIGLPVLIGAVIALPFSVARFKRWRGLKSVIKKKTKGIVGDASE